MFGLLLSVDIDYRLGSASRRTALPCARNCDKPQLKIFELEATMAEHREVEYATATGNDYAEHEGTYRLFVSLVKWHVIVIVGILLLMYFFLV
jgi:hypothetical protein